MAIIETEKWTPSPDNPDRYVYAGQRTAQEVFDDLKAHLKSIGYLPEDYFNFDCHGNWAHGREFPEGGWLSNNVDYGGNEGIYLDITLEYYEKDEHKREHFATGKTLGESGWDMDRMYLAASAITRAFHEDGLHARFIMVGGGEPAPEGIIVSLNPEERRVVSDGLTQLRAGLVQEDQDYGLAGQLLNRIGCEDIVQKREDETIGLQDLYVSPDFQCDQTDGYPASLCWDMRSGRAFLALNDSLAGEGEDVSHYEELCEAFGERCCESWDDFNAILEDLGEDAVQNAYVYGEDAGMGGMKGMA